ncbi:hypothetical protein [Spirosoma sp. 48-14]|uniref:hypothetical protein n=1 Tax=Spirosoma sp. 48-14 TaxID=1895854 RepID=UPI000960FAB4|nr:hypothetical protein [Spirosoma sp. 48-14]OJW75394.1 MAG: hypothetical protein BGO59_19895 [Spirosoma sp. 48-14]
MDHKQVSIICDTNIWYRLSDGRIDHQEIAGKHLIGTYINGYEFCTSPNGLKDYTQLRAAVMAFDQYTTELYCEPPIEYMKLVSGHQASQSNWEQISRLIKSVQRVVKPPESHEEAARKAYQEYYDQTERDNKAFLDMIDEHRKQIEFRGLHKKQMSRAEVRYQHKEITKQVITNTVAGLPLNWSALELYLSTFDEWIRQLSMQSSLKIKPNDWNDLLNLSYVRPGFLYWTEDHKKTWEFIHSCGCGHYLYKHL